MKKSISYLLVTLAVVIIGSVTMSFDKNVAAKKLVKDGRCYFNVTGGDFVCLFNASECVKPAAYYFPTPGEYAAIQLDCLNLTQDDFECDLTQIVPCIAGTRQECKPTAYNPNGSENNNVPATACIDDIP